MTDGGRALTNEVYVILHRVETLLTLEVGAVLDGLPPNFTEPDVTVEEAVVQLAAVSNYLYYFNDLDADFTAELHERAYRAAEDSNQYAAEVSVALANRYPEIHWLVGAETVRRIKEDLCLSERRGDRGLPHRNLYIDMRSDTKRLARHIGIAWKGGNRCAFFEPLLVPTRNKIRRTTEQTTAHRVGCLTTGIKASLIGRVHKATNRHDFSRFSRRRSSRLIVRTFRRTLSKEIRRAQVSYSSTDIRTALATLADTIHPAATELKGVLTLALPPEEAAPARAENIWKRMARRVAPSGLKKWWASSACNPNGAARCNYALTRPATWWPPDETNKLTPADNSKHQTNLQP